MNAIIEQMIIYQRSAPSKLCPTQYSPWTLKPLRTARFWGMEFFFCQSHFSVKHKNMPAKAVSPFLIPFKIYPFADWIVARSYTTGCAVNGQYELF